MSNKLSNVFDPEDEGFTDASVVNEESSDEDGFEEDGSDDDGFFFGSEEKSSKKANSTKRKKASPDNRRSAKKTKSNSATKKKAISAKKKDRGTFRKPCGKPRKGCSWSTNMGRWVPHADCTQNAEGEWSPNETHDPVQGKWVLTKTLDDLENLGPSRTSTGPRSSPRKGKPVVPTTSPRSSPRKEKPVVPTTNATAFTDYVTNHVSTLEQEIARLNAIIEETELRNQDQVVKAQAQEIKSLKDTLKQINALSE
jgi:hypothetical protein